MDKIGFEARVRALWPGMVRLARCVTHSHADAEDAAAQAVLNCYRRLASLRREDAFDAWLMRACLNEARQHPAPPGARGAARRLARYACRHGRRPGAHAASDAS